MLNNVVFKIVFADSVNVKLSCSLLNAILVLQGPDLIVEVTVLNPTNLKEFLTAKAAMLDIKVG